MADIGELHVLVIFDGESFQEAIARIIAALEAFAIIPCRPLSRPGLLAFRFCTWLGIAPLRVLAWLETCPGAFADEFGEGWE